MEFRISLLLLLLGSVAASSHKHESPAKESKLSPRYSDLAKHGHSYILEPEHDGHYGPHGGKDQNEDYVNSEEIEEHREKEEALGDENSDRNVKDDAYDDHAEKESHQEFQAGGLSFDKHLKDHKADNKEVDNVKAHNAGEKFGGEAVKEHKVGKHKEKSKGHKLHGFKNVYHKEEYGDHKTFHDEFLDSDHQHNYDDQHEHKEMQGGKYSKGFKHEGKNKKYDKGDEKREWGKEEFDSNRDGIREKGGQSSKHRHGSKKHQGHYDANTQKSKNSVRKVKKGNPPPPPQIPHVGHHGPHHAQIQPYVSHYNPPSHPHPHHDYSYSHYKPEPPHQVYNSGDEPSIKEYDGHHDDENYSVSHSGHQHDDDSHHGHDGSVHEFSQDDVDHDSHYEERTPKKHLHRAAMKENKEDEKAIVQKPEPVSFPQPAPVHYGVHQSRQPVYQEQPRFRQSDFSRQDRIFRPIENRFENQPHGYRYGFPQARYPFHQQREQQQPFPRFSHHSQPSHGHHHYHPHHGAQHHFRHSSRYHPQEVQPAVQAQTVVHVSKPRDDGPVFSQKHE